jgi:uncharacterized SAM-binding protein YcdF (DUF218 family)
VARKIPRAESRGKRTRLNLRSVTSLPATSPASLKGDLRWIDASAGGLLGAVLWLEMIAFGLPRVFFETPGYSLIPIAVIVGAMLGRTRVRRALVALVVGLAGVLAIVAFTPVMRRPAHALIRSDPVGTRPVQAVIVLSGGITTDGHLRAQSLDRVLGGISLIKRGVAGTLIISRERWGPSGRGVTSDADQQRLVSLLERPVRLLIVDSVFSTRDEAVRMRALARTLDLTSVAIVTSPLHTYRACATFEKAGFTVTCVPSESRDVALGTLRLPTDRVHAFQLWLYELAGLAKYRLSGWI